jgi:hypothetical protein
MGSGCGGIGGGTYAGSGGISRTHEGEQPSPGKAFASSHSSPFSTRPLPQRGAAATCTGISRRQEELQPSPDTRFPSSQSSPRNAWVVTSPHRALRHCTPQASLGSMFPSSHSSPASVTPSPHLGCLAMNGVDASTAGGVTTSQVQSIAQRLTPRHGCPASHSSPSSRIPFPQREMISNLGAGGGAELTGGSRGGGSWNEGVEAGTEAGMEMHWHCTQEYPGEHGVPDSHCSDPSFAPFPQRGAAGWTGGGGRTGTEVTAREDLSR